MSYKVNKAEYVLSAAWQSQWPEPDDLPEVILAGRSNVGKSSFINTLTGVNGLAKVSGTPGKTRTLNFFNINDELRLVDVPGYGYAKVSVKQLEQFADTMETYLTKRTNLRGMIQLIDYRRTPNDDDLSMYEYATYYNIPVVIIATKMDKIKRNDLKSNEKHIRDTLGFPADGTFVRFSSLTKEGVDEAWKAILDLCAQGPIER